MTRRDVAIALLAGLVVLVLLFPASGVDTLPPECFSVFGYTVPCDGWGRWLVALDRWSPEAQELR